MLVALLCADQAYALRVMFNHGRTHHTPKADFRMKDKVVKRPVSPYAYYNRHMPSYRYHKGHGAHYPRYHYKPVPQYHYDKHHGKRPHAGAPYYSKHYQHAYPSPRFVHKHPPVRGILEMLGRSYGR